MGKRRPKKKKPARAPRSDFFVLDRFSVEDIRRWNARRDKILRYHWEFYSELAFQRNRIKDAIRGSLLAAATGPFAFTGWQRIVKAKYALVPLSAAGSLKEPGGRFNIPDINPAQFPMFPALYIAADKETALCETLGQKPAAGGRLTPLELALTSDASILVAAFSGSLETIIDLGDAKALRKFLDLIKGFKITAGLAKMAKEAGVPPPRLVGSMPELMANLLQPNWRGMPMQFDVPSSCQIFGQLVEDAGIEGMLFPSKMTGKDCLAIFPRRMTQGSFVEIAGEPVPGTLHTRMDSGNWQEVSGL